MKSFLSDSLPSEGTAVVLCDYAVLEAVAEKLDILVELKRFSSA